MITIRKSDDRGQANYGWLDTHYSFSFANYYDPRHMGFRSLRVINEDHIQAGMGFPTHPHRDMEIISYIVSGVIAHKDSLGNTETIGANGIQRFSAGTGIAHSEFNPSQADPLHLLQIWLLPEEKGITPSYEQKLFSTEAKREGWVKLASRDGSNGSVKIHQDAELYATILPAAAKRSALLNPDRYGWLQVVKGELALNGHVLQAGDGTAISQESNLTLEAKTEAEVLLFDLS